MQTHAKDTRPATDNLIIPAKIQTNQTFPPTPTSTWSGTSWATSTGTSWANASEICSSTWSDRGTWSDCDSCFRTCDKHKTTVSDSHPQNQKRLHQTIAANRSTPKLRFKQNKTSKNQSVHRRARFPTGEKLMTSARKKSRPREEVYDK